MVADTDLDRFDRNAKLQARDTQDKDTSDDGMEKIKIDTLLSTDIEVGELKRSSVVGLIECLEDCTSIKI